MVVLSGYWASLIIALGIALQIQITPFSSAEYMGLRLNLADALLPVFLLSCLSCAVKEHSGLPQWTWRFLPHTLFVLTLVMTASLFNGYLALGDWNTWALINKFIGWFVLLGYFFAGAWITHRFGSSGVALFLKSFLYSGIALLVAVMLSLFAEHITNWEGKFPFNYPAAGLMDNRNAYAFLILTLFIFSTVFLHRESYSFLRFLAPLLWGLMPFFLLYNGSRILWVLFPLVALILIFMDKGRSLFITLLPFAAGCILVGLLMAQDMPWKIRYLSVADNISTLVDHSKEEGLSQENAQAEILHQKLSYKGDVNRILILNQSLALWKENPVFGTGLGVAQFHQIRENGKILSVIDSTPLWLLTETGLIGLGAFILFYFGLLVTLLRKGWGKEGRGEELYRTMTLFLIAFGAMSLLHEILYTRFVWVLIGLSFAVAKYQSEKV